MSYINWIDYSAMHFLNQFAAKNEAFDTLVRHISDATLLQGGLFMTYFWGVWFKSDADASDRRRGILVSLFGASVIVLIARLLQIGLPFHARPLHTPELHFVPPIGVDPELLNKWSSFPSDHAALFFALSAAVWYESRILGYLAMAWTLIADGLSRAYLGFHYPSDIVGGAILGVVLMVFIRRVSRDAGWTKVLMRWEADHRAIFYGAAFAITLEIATLFDDFRELGLDTYHVLKAIVVRAAGNV